MDRIIKDNAAAGFPANIEFVKYLDKQISQLYGAWEDDAAAGEDYIVKGVSVIRSSTTISLTRGVVFKEGEAFVFAGAVLDTTDIDKIELYVDEQTLVEQFGDLQTYPAYKYRTLSARVSDVGNFMTMHRNRSYLSPIREVNKNIKINNLVGEIISGEIEHSKNKITVNLAMESVSGGTSAVFVSPTGPSQEIFNVYSRNSYKTYQQRMAGRFRTIQKDNGGNRSSVIGGDIIQEGSLFYFYAENKGRLNASEIMGLSYGGATLLQPVVIMVEFNIIIN